MHSIILYNVEDDSHINIEIPTIPNADDLISIKYVDKILSYRIINIIHQLDVKDSSYNIVINVELINTILLTEINVDELLSVIRNKNGKIKINTDTTSAKNAKDSNSKDSKLNNKVDKLDECG